MSRKRYIYKSVEIKIALNKYFCASGFQEDTHSKTRTKAEGNCPGVAEPGNSIKKECSWLPQKQLEQKIQKVNDICSIYYKPRDNDTENLQVDEKIQGFTSVI